MRKSIRNILTFASAAVMACGALSVAACANSFVPPEGLPEGYENVQSNGGFVVSVGDYYYFINGVETYTADNTYGKPVKGALMRVKKADVENGEGDKAEIVVPSLMVTGTNYNGGIFVYGDRVYYATPTNVKNTEGNVQNSYLDFVSVKLDGSDRKEHFRVSSNSTDYRYVLAGEGENKAVYALYYDSTATTLHSFNTAADVDTVLAKDVTSYVFNSADKQDPVVYYTMEVTDRADSDNPKSYDSYNQIYRVDASATEAPYEYKWDQEWLDENNEGEAPYVNLGEIVLDGIGANHMKEENGVWVGTQFNHGKTEPEIPGGYTYTLNSYQNDGLYFTRKQTDMETVGADNALYYLKKSAADADSWDSIGGNSVGKNDSLSLVANAVVTAKITATDASTLYYIDDAGHHFVYVRDEGIWRADAAKNGTIANEVEIANSVSGATLISLDGASDEKYKYVYYSLSNSGSRSVERAVYNGKAEDYNDLVSSDDTEDKALYHAQTVLDLQHASSWYNFEIIGTTLFFADADAVAYGSSALSYVSCVDLSNAQNKLLNNLELKALNEKYDEILGDEGLLAEVKDEQENDLLSEAMKYYFYTGETTLFEENIREAADGNDGDTEYLYSQEVQDAFKAFAGNEEVTYGGNTYKFVDEAGVSYRTRSYFVTRLGRMNDADRDSFENYWKTSVLEHYEPPVEEDKGLEGWKIAVIVVACALAVVAAAIVTAAVLLKKKRKQNAPKEERMHVDTTDDKDIDVYADDDREAPADELVEEYKEPETGEEEGEEPENPEDPENPENPEDPDAE